MSRSPLLPVSALVISVFASAAWASPGTVLRNERLYTQPSSGSRVAAQVSRGTAVDIIGKQGGWLRVTAGRTTGWIRLLSVRAGAGGTSSAGARDVFGAATRRSDASRVVSVAGLRGLTDEDLKLAKYNPDEVARLEAIDVAPPQAQSFARHVGLVTVPVPGLPEPRPDQPASSWEDN